MPSVACAPVTLDGTGEAIKVMEEVAAEVLPQGFDFAWSGLAFSSCLNGVNQSTSHTSAVGRVRGTHRTTSYEWHGALNAPHHRLQGAFHAPYAYTSGRTMADR